MNYRGLELKLRKIVEKRLEEGWSISPNAATFIRNGRCCLVGAVAVDVFDIENEDVEDSDDSRAMVASFLGISLQDARSLEAGFEDYPRGDSFQCREIGARIRRDYCEWK